MGENPSDVAFFREMGRALTAEISPTELPFYDELLDSRDRPASKKRDEQLAFGISPEHAGIAVILFEVGKVILEGIWTAARSLLAGLAKDVEAQVRAQLSEKIDQWIQSRFQAPPPLDLKPEAVREILASTQKSAAALGLKDSEIALLQETLAHALGVK
jgi:hypothetical protein